jgi:hypothetical protein
MIKRIALGFAVAGLVVPATAQARIDEGISGQPNSAAEISGKAFVPFATDFPKTNSVTVKAGDYGMPRAMPTDYAVQRGDVIEVARTHPRNEVRDSELIENARLAPRSVSTPQLVSSPGFDWSDAGIGAGLALALVLAGGAAYLGSRQLGRPQTA